MNGRNERRTLCRFLQTSQGCFRGDACRFYHDLSNHMVVQPKRQTTNDPFQVWARHVQRTNLSSLFTTALDLVRQNQANGQAVISRLATDAGLGRMEEVHINVQRESPGVFKDQVLPLLQLLCEDHVRHSFVTEKDVSTIYNFLYGPNGHRGTTIYTYVIKVFPDFCCEKTAILTAQTLNVLSISFSNMIELNSSSVLVDELEIVCQNLLAFLEVLMNDDQGHFLQPSIAPLEKAAKRFSIATNLAHATAPVAFKSSKERPVFTLARDGPGSLSKEGPRHDNDSHEITLIGCMPTAAELQNWRSEYLPLLDLSQSHEMGIRSLLDCQFRLLREDTVGQICDAVKVLINSDHAVNRAQTARTIVYNNASLIRLTFDKFRGLDLLYEFEQPKEVQNTWVVPTQ